LLDERCMYYLINGSVEVTLSRCRAKLAVLKVLWILWVINREVAILARSDSFLICSVRLLWIPLISWTWWCCAGRTC
jgi:hypothetical protein